MVSPPLGQPISSYRLPLSFSGKRTFHAKIKTRFVLAHRRGFPRSLLINEKKATPNSKYAKIREPAAEWLL